MHWNSSNIFYIHRMW